MADLARFSITTASPSTSATLAAHGSEAATKIPTACYASTSPNAQRSRTTHRPTSTGSHQNSTAGLDKLSDGGHHLNHSTRRCVDPLRPHQMRASPDGAIGSALAD